MSNISYIGRYAHILIFTTILGSLGLLLLVLPKQTVSDAEQRRLCPWPQFSWASLGAGTYTDSLDLYVSDHFPLRNDFLALSDGLQAAKGLPNQEEKIYTAVEAVDKLEQDTADIETTADSVFEDKEQLHNSKGLLVVGRQAMQIFTNEQPLAAQLAQIVNAYRKAVPPTCRVFCLLTPTVAAYALPEKYAQYQGKEEENIASAYALLSPGVQAVAVAEKLRQHQKEYIFYRTDHHWTGLGAYYAYQAFGEKAAFPVPELAQLERRTVAGTFLGTHYRKTRDENLAAAADTVHYWLPQGSFSAEKIDKNGIKKSAEVFKNQDIEKNRYLVFLGGDEPLMYLYSATAKNGKTILLVKNSYGNAFAPYLLNHYEKVVVVDYRYFKGKITDLFKKHTINDLLILSGVFAANEPSHLKKMNKILQ
jgi:hypothetical protein